MRSETAAFLVTAVLLLCFLFAVPALLSLTHAGLPAPNPYHPPPASSGSAPAPASDASRPVPVLSLPKVNLSNQTIPNLPPEPSYDLSRMEADIHVLVNAQRAEAGLKPLGYDNDIATVARLHSTYLARDNGPLTDPSLYCTRPFIHHEGFDFGLYETDRMYNRSIYDFSAAGENIFMTSAWSYLETTATPDPGQCPDEGTQVAKEYSGPDAPAQVQADYQTLLDYVKTARRVNWTSVQWTDQPSLESSIVDGWMGSPGHRANILNPNYTDEGIGVAKVNDFFIVTEDFITKVDCGYTGASCCQLSETEYYCYDPWRCKSYECS